MKTPEWLEVPSTRSWQRLFSITQNKRSLLRLTRNEPIMVAPPLNGDAGIRTDDPRFVRFQTEIPDVLNAEFPIDVRDDGFAGPSAIISDFHALRNRAGCFMNPISIPMKSNSFLQEDLNLAPGFLTERDAQIFKDLHQYMFRTIVPSSMSIRKTASSGAPFFTASLEVKKLALALFNTYSSKILANFGAGRLEQNFDDYELFHATYMGVRTQPDSVIVTGDKITAKAREVNDEIFARTAGKQGRRFTADKSVRDRDGNVIPGIFAMRRRSVYAYPSAQNYWLTQFFAPLRAFYLNDAAFTYKHRHPEEIAEKLRGFRSVRGYDVKQFDQSIQSWILDAFVDHFTGFIKEEVLFFFRKLLSQPIYAPHPEVVNAAGYDKEPFKYNPCFGDPFDLSTFDRDVGLPSGIGPNPDMGKFFMTFAYLCLFDRHFHDVREVGVQKILRGEHDRYALLDMCDDAVIAVNDESFWATAERVIAEKFYVRIEAEEGIAFLGNVLFKDSREVIQATSNLVTFFRNRLCPEHGVDHWSRRAYVGTGWFEGQKHYATAPRFGEAVRIWDELWRKHFDEGMDVRFFAAQQAERHRGVPSLSMADRMVLENPDKLYYRYELEELHPWVLDRLVGVVKFDEYFPSIEKFFY